uniref:BTB domain-containing protein n=1 Tax=Arundo donax TaxID=35708 RepID=A0A0A9G836_ARUDO
MSAAPQRPRTRTASVCTAADTSRGTHTVKISRNSQHRGLGVGRCVNSSTFAVGGHDWSISYYPDGRAGDCDYVAVYLVLMSKNAEVTVLYDLRLIHPSTGLPSSMSSLQAVFNAAQPSWGMKRFMKKSDLYASGYLLDDCLQIECGITIVKVYEVEVPPSNLFDNLGKLLEWKEGFDVRFKVKGEVFRAHRIVLAMRSLVFKAELYGPMSDKNKIRIITVEDMQPPVFKALLHFIYTDSLPARDVLEGDENREMVKHLLVAADRYAMKKMKMMCESILCRRLDIESVAATLVLADQHDCSRLKDVCIRFINSSNRVNDVLASQGYEHLKRACPALTVELWEKSSKSRKI